MEISLWTLAAWVRVGICTASAVPAARTRLGLLLAVSIIPCRGQLSSSGQAELLCNFFTVNERKMSLSFSLESCAAPV